MSIYDAMKVGRLIAKRYEERGYTVTVEPPPSAIPFDLEGYKADLLAVKGDEKLLIEVKGPRGRVNQERYLRIDQEIQKHPGWKFLLVTVSADELRETVSAALPLASLDSIRDRLRKLDQLLEIGDVATILFPMLWGVYVMTLRLLLQREGSDLEGLTDLSVVNKAYTDGLLSIAEYEDSRRLLQLRNTVVHSVDEIATKADCDAVRRVVGKLLAGLQ